MCTSTCVNCVLFEMLLGRSLVEQWVQIWRGHSCDTGSHGSTGSVPGSGISTSMGAANELCDPGQITLASLCLMGVRTASLGGLSSAVVLPQLWCSHCCPGQSQRSALGPQTEAAPLCPGQRRGPAPALSRAWARAASSSQKVLGKRILAFILGQVVSAANPGNTPGPGALAGRPL